MSEVVFKRLLKGSLTKSQYYTKLSSIVSESISEVGNMYLIETWSGRLIWFAEGKCLSDYCHYYSTNHYPTQTRLDPSTYGVEIDDPFMAVMLSNNCFDCFSFYCSNVTTYYEQGPVGPDPLNPQNIQTLNSSITYDLYPLMTYNSTSQDNSVIYRGISTGNRGLICSIDVIYPGSSTQTADGYYPFLFTTWYEVGDEVI